VTPCEGERAPLGACSLCKGENLCASPAACGMRASSGLVEWRVFSRVCWCLLAGRPAVELGRWLGAERRESIGTAEEINGCWDRSATSAVCALTDVPGCGWASLFAWVKHVFALFNVHKCDFLFLKKSMQNVPCV